MRQFLIAACAALVCSVASAQEPATTAEGMESFGAFVVSRATPDIVVLRGEVNPTTPLDFKRLLNEFPAVNLVLLDSGGGDVTAALLVAQEVADLGFDTYVPEQAQCYSACAFIFFAGENRLVHGLLGVHQIRGEVQDEYGTQLAIADILESLNEFDVPSKVITDMLRTPARSIKLYNSDEAETLGINRRAEPPASAEASDENEVEEATGLKNRIVTAVPMPVPRPPNHQAGPFDFGIALPN